MNRDEVLKALPGDDEFRAAPNYRKKEFAEGFIRAALDQLDAEGREPDRWEGEHLATAIGYLATDWYHASIAAAHKALAPADERADPDSWARDAETVTKRALRDGLDDLAGKAAKNG